MFTQRSTLVLVLSISLTPESQSLLNVKDFPRGERGGGSISPEQSTQKMDENEQTNERKKSIMATDCAALVCDFRATQLLFIYFISF